MIKGMHYLRQENLKKKKVDNNKNADRALHY